MTHKASLLALVPSLTRALTAKTQTKDDVRVVSNQKMSSVRAEDLNSSNRDSSKPRHYTNLAKQPLLVSKTRKISPEASILGYR